MHYNVVTIREIDENTVVRRCYICAVHYYCINVTIGQIQTLPMYLAVVVVYFANCNIQQINTYLVGYNSWSFHLSNIDVPYDLNTIKKR